MISVLLGKTKTKQTSYTWPPVTKPITASVLFFSFFVLSSVGVTNGHLYLPVLLRVTLGWGKGARQISVRKAIPGANASRLYRESSYSLVFSLSRSPIVTVMLHRAQTKPMVREP